MAKIGSSLMPTLPQEQRPGKKGKYHCKSSNLLSTGFLSFELQIPSNNSEWMEKFRYAPFKPQDPDAMK